MIYYPELVRHFRDKVKIVVDLTKNATKIN